MGAVLFFVGVFVTGNFLGWVIHRVLHSRWAGKAYRAHLYHHREIYPPDRFLSDEYLDPPKHAEQAVYYLAPMMLVCALVAIWSWQWAILAAVETVAVLWLNEWMHNSLHIRGHWLCRFGWYHRLREIHHEHHVNVLKNLGIISFFPDRVMGTFADPEKL